MHILMHKLVSIEFESTEILKVTVFFYLLFFFISSDSSHKKDVVRITEYSFNVKVQYSQSNLAHVMTMYT